MEPSSGKRNNLTTLRNFLADSLADREYFRQLVKIGLPIALQYFVTSSLNMVGVMMVGQLGETAVAAVALAGQIFFLLTLVLFGITSGSAIFTAQLWGKQDAPNIRRVLGLCLYIGLAAGAFFFFVALLAPEAALEIYSKDPAVVALGSEYLRIFGWGYILIPITFSYAAVLRSTGNVKIPLIVSGSALTLNMLLSYLLIFGKFGLPAMGVRGAALATLIARVLECIAMLWLTYQQRTPAALQLADLLRIDLAFAARVLKPVLPVALNELLWSLGITAYSVVYARIGTESIAAMNIASSIDNMALVIFQGIANACAILVGNRIGANEERKAFLYAGRSLGISAGGAALMGIVILLSADNILTLYRVSPVVTEYALRILTIIGLLLWLRVSNMVLFVGIFRSGGDTRFAFVLDACIIWVVGVPLAFIGAFVFHLPVYWVYLLVMTEEFAKWSIGMFRFLSKKWIHNLAQTV